MQTVIVSAPVSDEEAPAEEVEPELTQEDSDVGDQEDEEVVTEETTQDLVEVDIDALRLKYGIRYRTDTNADSPENKSSSSETVEKDIEITVLVEKVDEIGRVSLVFDPPEVNVPQSWPDLSDYEAIAEKPALEQEFFKEELQRLV